YRAGIGGISCALPMRRARLRSADHIVGIRMRQRALAEMLPRKNRTTPARYTLPDCARGGGQHAKQIRQRGHEATAYIMAVSPPAAEVPHVVGPRRAGGWPGAHPTAGAG